MPSYTAIRTMKGLPIGSVQPWTGDIGDIPKGWLLANGAELEAVQYPLLARILKDTYGGVNFTGEFPTYSGTFRLPPTNQKGLADIDASYFNDEDISTGLRNNVFDTVEAGAIVGQFIGEIGDLGVPSSTNAVTDLLFTYTPDPDGVLLTYEANGDAPSTDVAQVYEPGDLQITQTGSGSGASFRVVQNTNGTYSTKLVSGGQLYEQDDIITILGTSFNRGEVGGTETPGTSPLNDLRLTVKATGDGFFEGNIEGQSVIPGFGIESIYIVPRKLSRNHFPQHFHVDNEGFATINKNDSGELPGLGVGVFDTPEISVTSYWYRRVPCEPLTELAGTCDPAERRQNRPNPKSIEISWGNQTGSENGFSNTIGGAGMVQPFNPGAGRYAVAFVQGTRPIEPHTPTRSRADGHGVGKNWFTDAKKLRVSDSVVSPGTSWLESLRTDGKIIAGTTQLPYSDTVNAAFSPNFDDGGGDGNATGLSDGLVTPTSVLMNSAAIHYNKTESAPGLSEVIQSHNHGGEFTIIYNGEALQAKSPITASAAPNVIPDDIPEAFQVTFTTTSPSMACVHLIRAY